MAMCYGLKLLAYCFKGVRMFTEIKPGPKPKREDGKDDRRRHVVPPNDKKHPTLPVHKHKPGD